MNHPTHKTTPGTKLRVLESHADEMMRGLSATFEKWVPFGKCYVELAPGNVRQIVSAVDLEEVSAPLDVAPPRPAPAPAPRKAPAPRRVMEPWGHEVVEHAIRWSSNILVEVLGNYGSKMTEERRAAFRRAVEALADADRAPR